MENLTKETKQVYEYDVKNKITIDKGSIVVFRDDDSFYDYDSNHYWNNSFLSGLPNSKLKEFVIENNELWFENEAFYMTSQGIYRKSDDNPDELYLLSNYPMIPIMILKTEDEKICKVKHIISGKFKANASEENKHLVNKTLYSMSTINLFDFTNFKVSSNNKNMPEHIRNGWNIPKNNQKDILELFEHLKNEAEIRYSFEETGWHFDPLLQRKIFVTPGNNFYTGNAEEYTSTKGTYEEWKGAYSYLGFHSNRLSWKSSVAFGSLVLGLIDNSNNINPFIYTQGDRGCGKSLEEAYISSILGEPAPGIAGISSLAGLEVHFSKRNHCFLQIDEMDGFIIKKDKNSADSQDIEKLLTLANGNERAVMRRGGKVNKLKSRLVVFGTGNKFLEQYLQNDEKGQAFLDRCYRLRNDDPDIKPLPKGFKTVEVEEGITKQIPIFDNEKTYSIIKNNYGWGFVKAIEILSNDPDYWSNIFNTTLEDIKEKFTKETNYKDGEDGASRQLHLLAVSSVGIQLMKEIVGEVIAEQAQSVLEILINRLVEEKTIDNPRIKAIKSINKLISGIVLNRKLVVWKNYAWSEECENLNELSSKNLQKETALTLNNNRNQNANCILVQNKPFRSEFDYDCEILIPLSNVELKFGNIAISVDEIKNAADELCLYKTYKNKGRSKDKIIKQQKVGLKDKAFFPNEDNLLRIEVDFESLNAEYEEYKTKNGYYDIEDDENNDEFTENDKVVSIKDHQVKKEPDLITKTKPEEAKEFLNIFNNK